MDRRQVITQSPAGYLPKPGEQDKSGSQSWRALLWKLLVALLFAFVVFGVPAPGNTLLFVIPALILAWGALFVGFAEARLLSAAPPLRLAMSALTVGAYGALALPAVITGDATKMLDGLGPVVALTLAAQLARRDLAGAMHDWAAIAGLSVYAALGVQALWLLTSFGPAVFSVVVLLPPVTLEVALLLLRSRRLSERAKYRVSIAVATAISIATITFTQYNSRMPLEWRLFFDGLLAILIGGALLLGLMTRHLFAGGRDVDEGSMWSVMSRALVELTHGVLLLALAVYIPMGLFTR